MDYLKTHKRVLKEQTIEGARWVDARDQRCALASNGLSRP
jgi:hypothetical protein